MSYRLSKHVQDEMACRGISASVVDAVISAPEQVIRDPLGLNVCQSRVQWDTGKTYLVRVFVNDGVDPPLVVTVYRTSKIEKYWSKA